MAAGIARTLLARRLGCEVGDLRHWGVEAASAGLFAADGFRAVYASRHGGGAPGVGP